MIMNTKKHTISFHVDDILSYRVDSKMNDEFDKWANSEYGKLKPAKIHQEKVNEFLEMALYFSIKGECHVLQK